MYRRLLVFYCTLILCKAIYSPSDRDVPRSGIKGKVIGMKTLDWQNYNQDNTPNHNLQVFQNYTNVKVQQHNNDENLRTLYENNRLGKLQQATFDDEDTHGTTNDRYGSTIAPGNFAGVNNRSSSSPCFNNCTSTGNFGYTRPSPNNYGVSIPENYPNQRQTPEQTGQRIHPVYPGVIYIPVVTIPSSSAPCTLNCSGSNNFSQSNSGPPYSNEGRAVYQAGSTTHFTNVPVTNIPNNQPQQQGGFYPISRPSNPSGTTTILLSSGYNPYAPASHVSESHQTPQGSYNGHSYGHQQPTVPQRQPTYQRPCHPRYGCAGESAGTQSHTRTSNGPFYIQPDPYPKQQQGFNYSYGGAAPQRLPTQPTSGEQYTVNPQQPSHYSGYGGITIHGMPVQPTRGQTQQHSYNQNVFIPQNYYSGKIPSAGQNTGHVQAVSKCPQGATGYFPYEASCNQFLNCVNGRGVVQNCAPGTLFSPVNLECDFPGKVNCVSGPRSARFIDVGNLSEKRQANCPNGYSGIIPHYTDCSRFINCDNGRQHDMSCPPGTLFNMKINACDHAHKAVCPTGQNEHLKVLENQPRSILQSHQFSNAGSYSSQTQTSGSSSNQVAQCPPNYSGIMAHPSDCSKFLNCGSGQTHIMDCGPGTLFNAKLKVCDHAHNVDCQNSPPVYNQQSSQGSYQGGTESRYNLNQNQDNNKWNQYQGQFTAQNTNNQQSQYQGSYQTTTVKSNNWSQTGNTQHSAVPSYNAYNSQQTGSGTYTKFHYITKKPPVNPLANTNQQGQTLEQQIDQLWGNLDRTTESTFEPLTASPTTYKNKQWPPPFPSTDVNADYVFEYDDLLVEPDVDDTKPSINWCDRKGFECGNKVCIAPTLVCNGEKDCPNGADEKDCDLSLSGFSKTAGTKLAVKETNKLEKVTVASCARSCVQLKCKGFNFRKHDGTCYILNQNVGTSGALIILPMYDYYENDKFIVDCTKLPGYICSNKRCITKDQLCDGVNDCGDGMDEKGCTADAFDYKIRLVGGPNKHSGRIEIEAFGKVGYVCDDMFGLKNADVVCRELGYPLGAAEVRGNSYFAEDIPPNKTQYLMDDVSCSGNETSLRDCDFAGWGKHNCQGQEIVGVACKTPISACPTGHWQCANLQECLPLAFVCDGVYDCTDKSDESSDLCDKPTEVRLSQGTKGRVELKHNGVWGTICDDDFNDDAAKVICRQLGFKGSAKVVKDGQFGAGTGPIWLDQVFCLGNETEIEDCVHWDWGEHNCEHTEDVGVICNNIGTPRNLELKQEERTITKLPEKCGFRSDALITSSDEEDDDVHFRVVQGSYAKPGEYPWQASIRVNGKTKSAHWCGAVVISSQFVLTAAHCLRGFSKGAYFIVAGDYDASKDEGTEQEAYIDDFIIHPNFGMGNKMNNDIALVRLKGRGLKISKDVQPICLPSSKEPLPIGLNCTISGFGSIESGKSRASKHLRAGWIPILSKEVCQMPHVYGESITAGMLCAGFMTNGVDACDGDSGGPMACLHDGVFKLFGITSWGQHCGYANKPGVYVNVITYRDWIEEAMKKL